MMQFLKSTLFPDRFSKTKKPIVSKTTKRIDNLQRRISEKDKQVEELQQHVQSLAVVITALATDLQALLEHTVNNRDSKSQSKDIFSMYKLGDDDDDGYLH